MSQIMICVDASSKISCPLFTNINRVICTRSTGLNRYDSEAWRRVLSVSLHGFLIHFITLNDLLFHQIPS